MDQQVSEYIEKINQKWQSEIASQLRNMVNQAVEGVEERIQYGKPHFLKDGKYVAVMGTAKGWVSFTIFNAQEINPPSDVFESSTNGDRKTIKITEGQQADYVMLGDLLKQTTSTL